MTDKIYKTWADEKLRRKANQAWEMAGLARQDRAAEDERRWTSQAQAYDFELKERNQ